MKNKANIRDVLLELSSGYSFRSKVENDPEGDLNVIQMKDLEDNYTRIGRMLTKIDSSKIPSKYLLQKGDILFVAKGANNFALEYDLDLPKATAASAFFVLRPDPIKVHPAYLAWYINQKPVQQYLKENMAGTYVPNINKSTVEGIEIVIPPMKKQIAIASLQKLLHREHRIMQELTTKRIQLVQKLLLIKVCDQ